MTDNELKEYQVLANKAFALYMLNPTPANRKIAADAAMAYKEAILISEVMTYKEGILVSELMSKSDNSAEYIDSLFEDDTNE